MPITVYPFNLYVKFPSLLNTYLQKIPNLPQDFSIENDCNNSIVNIIYPSEIDNNTLNLLTDSIYSFNNPMTYNDLSYTETINTVISQCNSSHYTTIGSHIWYANNIPNMVFGLAFVSNLTSTNSDNSNYYQVRLYDVINNVTLLESDKLYNMNIQINDLDYFIPPPTNTLLEVQVKVSDTNHLCNVRAIHLEFYNVIT